MTPTEIAKALRAWAGSQPPTIAHCAVRLADEISVWEKWPESEAMHGNAARTLRELEALTGRS